MHSKIINILILIFLVFSCSKKNEVIYEPSKSIDPYIVYKEGLEAFEKNDYFFANKKFSQAELNFSDPILAARSAIMSSYSLYAINFYSQAEDNIKRYLATYPSDKNNIYAQYLLSIIYFEQIGDEKRFTTFIKIKKTN